MSDDAGQPENPEQSTTGEGETSPVSRRSLLKTGGALAAGTGVAALVGESSAAAALPLPFVSATPGGFAIKFSGPLSTVTGNLAKANSAKQYHVSAVLAGVTDALVATHGGLAAVQSSSFSLSFVLSFNLSWPF